MAEQRIPLDSLTFLDLESKETTLEQHTWKFVLLVFIRHLA